jgi:MFS family permease
MAQPIIQALLSPLTGRLSDKIEPRIVATIGIALSCLGLLSFIFLTGFSSIIQIIVGLLVTGAGFAFFLSPNTNAIMSSVAPKFLGVASATMSTMISVGQMLSMGITMIVLALVVGRVVITPEYYSSVLTSVRFAFVIFTVLGLGGVFVSLFRGKIQR